MAIKEIKREWCPSQLAYVKEFLLHCEEELQHMPRCSVGSKATVSETDNEYVKTTDGWKLLCDCDEDGGQGAGGGSSVQPDWNQNDETAPDYVKNRTHYAADETETVFLPAATYDFAEDRGAMFGELPINAIKGGATYVVTMDGVEYVCNAKPYYEDYWFIGNDMFIGGEDTGEPFCIAWEGGGYCVVFNDAAAQHTISIIERNSAVVTLPEKFLPMDAIIEAVNSVLKITYVDIPNSKNGVYEAFEKSFDEINTACMNGLVIGKDAGRTYVATRNCRNNATWYVDFFRYHYDSNETTPYLSVISLSKNNEVTETRYKLTT